MHDGFLRLAIGHDFHVGICLKRKWKVLESREFFAGAEGEFRASHALCSALAGIKIDQRVNLGGVIRSAVFKLALAGLHADDLDVLSELHLRLSVDPAMSKNHRGRCAWISELSHERAQCGFDSVAHGVSAEAAK